MDENTVQEIMDELLASIEPLETQSAALLQFLKAKGIATDEELAPFLAQAGNTSNVRWRGVRVRLDALIANAMNVTEDGEENSTTAASEQPDESGEKPHSASRRDADALEESQARDKSREHEGSENSNRETEAA